MAVQVAPLDVRVARDSVNLLGTQIDCVAREDLSMWIERFVESGTSHQIITANLDFIAIARRRAAFAQVIAQADLVVCDGKPLQWASQIEGHAIPARITGTEVVLRTAEMSQAHGYRIFLLGGATGVAERAAARMHELFPGVEIAGTYSPPLGEFDDEENARIVNAVRGARTDVLFVALGAPRQDEWISAHREELGVPLCVGIGGVFNFLAGEVKRAPVWMQSAGLEWLFRLAMEPSRLWRRYLVDDLPIFAHLVAAQVARRAHPALVSPLMTLVAFPRVRQRSDVASTRALAARHAYGDADVLPVPIDDDR